jgi:DNA repair exonuclease SbcCD ATPase subunit
MTSDPVTFLWAELEGVRGFRDQQRIELDASAVILAGPNGTGKTSFFDALQWLLLGSIKRLEPWRTRRNTEHIANVFRPDQPAIVRAALSLGDQVVELRREGRYDSGFLEWADGDGVLRGDEAERRLTLALSPRSSDPASLHRLLMTSALLQQDVVREVLEDKPGDRYQHLASLLGLNDIAGFELAVRRRADRLASSGRAARDELAGLDGQHRSAIERLERLRAAQAGASDTSALQGELASRLATDAEAIRIRGLPAVATDAAVLQTRTGELRDEMTQISLRADGLRESKKQLQPDTERSLTAARRAAEEASKAVDKAKSKLAKAEADFASALSQSEALASLAHAALPLLSEHCPVCEQEIDQDHVQRHLTELLEQEGGNLPRLEAVRDAALRALQGSEEQEQQALAVMNDLLGREAEAARLDQERVRLIADVQSVTRRARDDGIDLIMADALARLEMNAIEATLSALGAAWRVFGELANVLRMLPASDQIATAQTEVRRLETRVVAAREKTALASANEEEAKTLQRATTRAAAAVTEDRFRRLAPLVSDIFSRLDPHPVFKTLDFALGVYRERGEASPIVRDAQFDIEADPLLVFSSSQANVAALSYFLALGWAAGEDAMPFVLLDDPLQSLDDVNALGFGDLCRHIRQQRQLIVSTHDSRLAALLERKLAPRVEGLNTRVVEFRSWTRSGPELEQRTVEAQLSEGSQRTLISKAA